MSDDEVLAAATQLMLMAIILSVTLLFGGIVVLVVIHVCIVGRASRRGFSNGTMVERGSAGSTSMSRDDLDKLPCYDYRANEERSSSPMDCAVCLENFNMGDKCRLLPTCKHSFHAQCVDAWLLKTPICPICRTSAESWKGGSVSGKGSSHFSDLSVELRGSQTTGSSRLSDIRIELTESPIIESSRESDIGIELRENQRVESRSRSTHFSDLSVELRGRQTTGSSHLSDIRIELTESPTIESSSESDIGIELRENQRAGSRSRSTHLNDAGVELEDGQANTVGNQLSSDPSPLLDV